MKKFEIGDRVSFINEKQDGVIKKILPNGICVVEIEDGFEIDATPGELVKIQTSEKKKVDATTSEQTVNKEEVIKLRNILTGLNETVTFILLPSNSNQVLTGPVKYFILNNSQYDVLYSFSYRIGRKPFGVSSGKVMASGEIYLGEVARDVLMECESLQVQLMFHQSGAYQPESVVTKEIAIEYPDLNYVNKNVSGTVAFCKTTLLVSFAQSPEEDLSELVKKFQADKVTGTVKQELASHTNRSKPVLQQYNVAPGFVEVDLHIEELVDDISGLSNTEMIEIQLQQFRKAIDKALLTKAHKITFIHGIGNGKLKKALIAEINSIPYLSYRDAAYEKYGAGATEVLLK